VAAAILSGVLHGLHAAHEARSERGEPLRIVHRDVSPHNVLVALDGVPFVLDFGIAKATSRIQTTREGRLKGKLAYMAPEQLTWGEVGRWTDVYAASVVLWEALSGRRLFEADNDYALMDLVKAGRVEPPGRYAPLPPGLDAIVLQGLSHDPRARFATARDMAAALERCVGLATPLEVAGWVETIAGEAIRARSRVISQIERGDAPPAPQDAETASVLVPPLPPPMGSTDTGDAPTRSIPEEDAPTRALASVAMPVRPAATLGVRHAALALAVAGTVVAGGAMIALYSTRAPGGAVRSPASGEQAVSAPPPAPAEPSHTEAAVTPPPSAEPAAAWATSAAAPEPPASTARAHAHARSFCDPPYTVDARGIRRIKRECVPR
jgi:serine/threonine-protein kinase